jgi:hypothetical protein
LYYYGQDDLKHKFIVIGEKEGSEGAECRVSNNYRGR